MKTLSSNQIDDVLYFITDLVIKNNPEMDEDEVYDHLYDYWVADILEKAIDYISEQ